MADYEPVVRYTITRAEAEIVWRVLSDHDEFDMTRVERMIFHRALSKLDGARKKQAQRAREKRERKAIVTTQGGTEAGSVPRG